MGLPVPHNDYDSRRDLKLAVKILRIGLRHLSERVDQR
jgi:hypothetical protein